MKFKRRGFAFLLAFGLAALVVISASAQQRQELTVEWMFGYDPDRIAAVPSTVWLTDGTALLYDTRMPEPGTTFESLDPRSGARRPALAMQKAIASLRMLLDGKEVPALLPWPLSFDESGRHGVYLFHGDVFVLDIAAAKFQRVTESEAEEKAVTLSPDGRFVAFVRGHDLYVYDLQQKVEKRLTLDGSDTTLNGTFSWVYWEEIFGHHEAAYWWSPDSRSIAFLRTDESPVSTMYFTDFQPYEPRIIKQRYPKAGEPTPVVRLGIADIGVGGTTWMKFPGGSYEYIIRVGWLPGSDRVSVQTMNRAQKEVNLFLVDRSTGKAVQILQESDDAWMHIYDPYFLKNGKYFIWISDRTGFTHLYLYDMDGRLVNQVSKGEWSVHPFGAFAIYEGSPVLAVDEQEELIYFTAAEKSAIERHLYRIRFDGNGFQRLSQEHGYHRPLFSRDARYYLDNYSNISTPPAFALHRSDGKQIQTLAAPRLDLLAPFGMQYPTFMTIPAADGFPLPAQLSKPKDFDPKKKYPVILYVYGGPASPTISDSWNSNGWGESIYFDQVLLNQGYLVMSVDNRSSAGIGKGIEKSIRGQMYGDVELNDLVAAVKWMKAQSYVDPERVGVWGWSGGGMYTLLAMTHTKEFKAGISVAPVTDWHYYDAKWTELIMKRPEDNPEGYRKTSLVREAANLHGRLLLVHGTYDDNVHPQNSQAFVDELIKAGILFDLMVYPMRQHTIADAPARIHLFNTMVQFWRRNL